MLRIGYKASAEQFGPRRLLDLAVLAEHHGFESVWTSDHFQPWRHTDGHAPNALAWLGAAATATERVTLGTSVLTPTLRYNPAVVAQAFATLGCLAPERVVLGVGTGESLNEIVVGEAWPEQKERFHRLKESVELMSRLFRDDLVTYEGDELPAATPELAPTDGAAPDTAEEDFVDLDDDELVILDDDDLVVIEDEITVTEDDDEVTWTAWWERRVALKRPPTHRLLGWPDWVQDPALPPPPPGTHGWRLLLQLDSVGWGLDWGDSGCLYLLVPDLDLLVGRLDRLHVVMHSA